MNIYNKFISFPNGTLINNWFEEDELKKKTGVTRTIPGYPYKIRNATPEIRQSIPRDNTFKRVIGEKEATNDYFLTSSLYGTYGNFSSPCDKYTHSKLREEEKNQKFQEYLKQHEDEFKAPEWEKYDPKVDLKSTYSTSYTEKEIGKNLGRRIMFDQFHDPITADKPDKLFMAQHDMSKYPSILKSDQVKKYVNGSGRGGLYSGNREITFWSSHLGNSNMYHTFTFEPNPFGRSHAFSQPVQKTKGPNCQNQFFPNTETLPPLGTKSE
ncbi:MAG: hypothetical protein MJ252_12600 [archaeon]|nr:hypothetical protein [archaeon]